MKICVYGLWHLGSVTAACLARVGHNVIGLDPDVGTVLRLCDGVAPVSEPGLEDILRRGISEGRLDFTTDRRAAVEWADAVWVTFDTPVGEDDRADTESVVDAVSEIFSFVRDGQLMLISSQLPVGTTRRIEQSFSAACAGRSAEIAYSPENLRLGRAVSAFLQPDRIVVGTRDESTRARIHNMLAPITEHIEWMSIESAEMTKHALNAFFATSVALTNELATICEAVGADAKEVERGLRSESRVGPKAYVSPGAAYAGGTLARDISFLTERGSQMNLPTSLLRAVKASNDEHLLWPRKRLLSLVGDLRDSVIALWGLTYKPGTDTLRRSSAVELSAWLAAQGVRVRAHDPAVKARPAELSDEVRLCPSPIETLRDASALVLCTEWPVYREIPPEEILSAMKLPIIIDANRFLDSSCGIDSRFTYISVGRSR